VTGSDRDAVPVEGVRALVVAQSFPEQVAEVVHRRPLIRAEQGFGLTVTDGSFMART